MSKKFYSESKKVVIKYTEFYCIYRIYREEEGCYNEITNIFIGNKNVTELLNKSRFANILNELYLRL